MAIASEMPELAMEVYSFFCQGFSEDLPHHTARIFAQVRQGLPDLPGEREMTAGNIIELNGGYSSNKKWRIFLYSFAVPAFLGHPHVAWPFPIPAVSTQEFHCQESVVAHSQT
jgi:hypothetical protein